MEFNDLLRDLGHFRRFQKQQYFLLALVIPSMAFQILGNVFILAIPKHRCAVPGLTNDTYQIQNEQHAKLVALSIPMTSSSSGGIQYSKCDVYSNFLQPRHDSSMGGIDRLTAGSLEEFTNSSTMIINGTDVDNSTQTCSHWVFDESIFSQTASSQFDLVCGRELFRSHLVMALMSGQMVGALFTGPLTDHFGRKTILVAGLLFHLLVSVSSAFAAHVYVLAALYFLNGAMISLIGCSLYTLAMELVGPRWRHVAGILIFSFWTLGMALLALLAYLIRDWRHLQLATSCPIVLYLSYHFLVKESLRWLHSKGRFEQTKKILEEAAATNGVKLNIDTIQDLESHTQVDSQSESILSVFRHPSLIGRLLIVCINWFMCSLTYYGLSLNVGTLSGNIFLNFVLSALFEFLGYVVISLILMKLGRKTLYCGSILLAGSSCLLTIFPVLYGDESTMWTVRMLANIGKFGISGAFAIAWMFTSELFPTSFRASVIATGSFFARVGAISASYIAFLGEDGELQGVVPQIVFGTGGLVVGLLAMMLPETKDRHLPQSIRDATRMDVISVTRKADDKGIASQTVKPLIRNDISL